MTKEIRLEEETLKLVKASELIEKKEKKLLTQDDLSCDCLTCQKRKEISKKKDQTYRED